MTVIKGRRLVVCVWVDVYRAIVGIVIRKTGKVVLLGFDAGTRGYRVACDVAKG